MTPEEEMEAMARFTVGKQFENWKIVEKLDEGGFGQVYVVQNMKQKTKFAALKAEPTNVEGGSAIKLETEVLKVIHKHGVRKHVPELYRSAKHRNYCYMIITLLGDNLRSIKELYYKDGMKERTWARIAIQCLYGIKTLHDSGFVHRDIKSNNFVLGHQSEPENARVVHLLDFGLARSYAFLRSGKFVPRKARGFCDFRGTWKFASPSMHDNMEQGRKDDVWSFVYMLIDLRCGLPWQHEQDKEQVQIMKLHYADDHLMMNMPNEVRFIPTYLRELDVYNRPDYYRIFQALDKIIKRTKTSFHDSYEWESKDAAAVNKAAMIKAYARDKGYTDAGDFFKADPVQINGPPIGGEAKGRQQDSKETHSLRKKKGQQPAQATESISGNYTPSVIINPDIPRLYQIDNFEREQQLIKESQHIRSPTCVPSTGETPTSTTTTTTTTTTTGTTTTLSDRSHTIHKQTSARAKEDSVHVMRGANAGAPLTPATPGGVPVEVTAVSVPPVSEPNQTTPSTSVENENVPVPKQPTATPRPKNKEHLLGSLDELNAVQKQNKAQSAAKKKPQTPKASLFKGMDRIKKSSPSPSPKDKPQKNDPKRRSAR